MGQKESRLNVSSERLLYEFWKELANDVSSFILLM
jgi:hypothetical protein